jgi:Pectate lyase superfamily protein
MRRRELGTLLSATAATLGLREVAAQTPGSAAPPALTKAEGKAGIKSINPAFPPGDVRRYGAKGDGATDDAPAFQAAIDAARLAGGKTIYSPTGAGNAILIPAPEVFYLLGSPLNCTFEGSANQHGLIFRGDAGPSIDTPAIIARHTGHVFDLTGCGSAILQDLNIGTDSATNPQTCFFLARNATRGSSGYHRFRNVRVHGKFSKTILYNYGSESNVLSECVWYNESTAPGTKVAIFTSYNLLSLTSSFTKVATGAQSNVDHQIIGGNFVNTSSDEAADVICLDGINSLKMFGPWMCAGTRASGRALIFVDASHAPSNLCQIFGLQGENGATQKYGVYFDGRMPLTSRGWTIQGCLLPSTTAAIFAAENQTLDGFHIGAVTEFAAHGLSAAGTVQSSIIAGGTMLLSIGTSRGNTLIGDSSRWTIARRSGDSWIDAGTQSRTWKPQTRELQVSGKLTVEEARCVYHGPMLTVTATLTAGSSMSCKAGATLGGLPMPAVTRSAQVGIVDANTGASLGCGSVIGDAIRLPAIAAATSIIVTATYFAA